MSPGDHLWIACFWREPLPIERGWVRVCVFGRCWVAVILTRCAAVVAGQRNENSGEIRAVATRTRAVAQGSPDHIARVARDAARGARDAVLCAGAGRAAEALRAGAGGKGTHAGDCQAPRSGQSGAREEQLPTQLRALLPELRAVRRPRPLVVHHEDPSRM